MTVRGTYAIGRGGASSRAGRAKVLILELESICELCDSEEFIRKECK